MERMTLREVEAFVSILENQGGKGKGFLAPFFFIFPLFLFTEVCVSVPGYFEGVPGTLYTCSTAVCTKTVNQS